MRAVLRRPVISVVCRPALLVALALPALQLHTKLPSFTDFPKDLPIVQAYERTSSTPFPGSQTPVVLVVSGDDVTTPQYRKAYAAFRSRAVATGEFFPPFHVFVNPDKTVARVEFSIAGKGDDKVSNHALATLRNDVIPPIADEAAERRDWAVTGVTAGTHDFNQRDEAAHADRVRVRARPRVPADAARVPLDRDPDQDGAAEPALGVGVVRRPRRGVPALVGARASSASRRTARSRRGCRSSSS